MSGGHDRATESQDLYQRPQPSGAASSRVSFRRAGGLHPARSATPSIGVFHHERGRVSIAFRLEILNIFDEIANLVKSVPRRKLDLGSGRSVRQCHADSHHVRLPLAQIDLVENRRFGVSLRCGRGCAQHSCLQQSCNQEDAQKAEKSGFELRGSGFPEKRRFEVLICGHCHKGLYYSMRPEGFFMRDNGHSCSRASGLPCRRILRRKGRMQIETAQDSLELRFEAVNSRADFALEDVKRFQNREVTPLWENYIES